MYDVQNSNSKHKFPQWQNVQENGKNASTLKQSDGGLYKLLRETEWQ